MSGELWLPPHLQGLRKTERLQRERAILGKIETVLRMEKPSLLAYVAALPEGHPVQQEFADFAHHGMKRDRNMIRAVELLRMVIRFHAGGEWTEDDMKQWKLWTSTTEATTKVMCDTIREALGDDEKPTKTGDDS